MKQQEHNIQCACVRWFRAQYPKLRMNLFAVPNGGQRNLMVAAKLKAEGVVAGVADLILLVPRGNYGALLIEMKTSNGKQSELQKKWAEGITEGDNYKYVICRSLNNFIQEVTEYLEQK